MHKDHILIIDDDPMMATSMKSMFKSWGYLCLVAQSGEEGVKLLKEHDALLVVSDMLMPGIDGAEVLRQIKESHPHVPVILLTGHIDVATAVRTMQDGAFDYIIKPPEKDQFKLVAERAIKFAQLDRENAYLRRERKAMGLHGARLIGTAPKMKELTSLIQRVAETDSTVLVTGETGTGKEVVARLIHFLSSRAAKPLIAVNCAALNEQLLESELFGHEKGAFTGAQAMRKGRFEDADGGTLFLDEISETTRNFKPSYSEFSQEGELQRVGGNQTIKVNVRIIASSNQDLEAAVKEKAFREDLYYRLHVVPLHLPPLKDRREDTPLLAQHFLDEYNESFGFDIKGFTPEALDHLSKQPWPGNVRELKHTIERAMILTRNDLIEPADLSFDSSPAASTSDASGGFDLEKAVDRATANHVIMVLDQFQWNHQAAAEAMGVGRSTLYRLLNKLRIERPDTAPSP